MTRGRMKMKEPFIKNTEDDSLLLIRSWEKEFPDLVAGFTTRKGGVSKPPFDSFNFGLHTKDENSDIVRNRELLAERLRFPLSEWVLSEQIHGTKVEIAGKKDLGKGALSLKNAIPGADGLITSEKGILCAAFFADCVPLFVIDPVRRTAGIAHAGWRGTVGGMAKQLIEEFEVSGSHIENLKVAIGPCISADHYEVDNRIIEQIDIELRSSVARKTKDNHYQLDLRQLNELLFVQAGLTEQQISVTARCTYADSEDFFSFRRDAGNTGRMLGFIGFRN